MKLSDIRGERTLEVIADLIDPICNIAQDEKAAALFKRERVPEGVEAKTFLLQRVQRALPSLLKEHKGDLMVILAAIEGVSLREYEASLNLAKLMKDWIDLMTDRAFLELFTSAQTEASSGSAQENTVGRETPMPSFDTLQPDGNRTSKSIFTAPM